MRVNLLDFLGIDVKRHEDEKDRRCPRSFGFFCKKCGTELIGEYDESDRVDNTSSWITSSHVLKWILQADLDCPICGDKLEKRGGCFLADIFSCSQERASKEFLEEIYGVECIIDASFNNRYYYIYKPADGKALAKVDEKFIRMGMIREAAEKEVIQSEIEALVANCDIPASFKKTNTNVAQVKSDPEQLKDYILTLINLENGIYSLKQRLASLYYKRLQNDRFVIQCMHNDLGLMGEILRPWKKNYRSCLKELEAFKYREPVPVLLECPEEPVKPLLKSPGLFNRKKVLAENDELMVQYNTAMAAYNEAFAKHEAEKARLEQEAIDLLEKQKADQQIKTEQAKLEISNQKLAAIKKFPEATKHPSAATAFKAILDKEISDAEALMAKLYSARNELYSYNIIFAKYQDIVALSSFYEYLMSGRCSQLEGADGMYNLYESEIRANRVIAQLDYIVKSLDDIKNNQYMMYAELTKINSSLSTMNNTMGKALESLKNIEVSAENMNDHLATISQNTEVIAYNTAATAYYAKLNAELTNALGYMVAFN